MAYRINNGSGNASSASLWDSISNTPSMHATTNITLAGSSTLIGAVFTAPNTSNSCTGGAFYVQGWGSPNNTSTFTLILQEYNGTSWVTKASQAATFKLQNGNNQSQWFNIRFATPYTYTTTTAGYYRLEISRGSDSAGTINLGADSGGANFAFFCSDNRQPALGTTDNFIVTGNTGTATYTVTIDSNWTLGGGLAVELPNSRSVNNALMIIDSAILTPTTSASTTMTIFGNMVVCNNGAYNAGSLAAPFPSAYTHKIIQAQGGVNNNYCINIAPNYQGSWAWYGCPPITTSSQVSLSSVSGTTLTVSSWNGINTTYLLGAPIVFSSVGSLTNVVAGTPYYITAIASNSFFISATPGGTAINVGSTLGSPVLTVNMWRTKFSSGLGTVASPLILADPVFWPSGTEIIVGSSANQADTIRRWATPSAGDLTGTQYVLYGAPTQATNIGTITNANGNNITAPNNLAVGTPMILTFSGVAASGVTSGSTTVWVVAASATTFSISLTYGGSIVTWSGTFSSMTVNMNIVSQLQATYNSDSWIVNMTRNLIITSDHPMYGSAFQAGAPTGGGNAILTGGTQAIQWMRFNNMSGVSGGNATKGNAFGGGMGATGAVFGPSVSGSNMMYLTGGGSLAQSNIMTNCVSYGSDQGYWNTAFGESYTTLSSFTDCMAFRNSNGIQSYNNLMTVTRFIGISLSGIGVYQGSTTSLATYLDCEVHASAYGASCSSAYSTWLRGSLGTKGKNTYDLSGNGSGTGNAQFTNCYFGSTNRYYQNTNLQTTIYTYLLGVNITDQNEYYDYNGRWFSSGSYSQITGQCDQTTRAAQFTYKNLSGNVAGFSVYAQTTLQIQNSAYYAGSYTLPQLILSSDLGVTSSTVTAAASTASQTIGTTIVPATNNGYVNCTLSLQTNSSAANSQVVFTNLKGNIRAIGYQFVEVTALTDGTLYKPTLDPVMSFSTPVIDPFWSVTNPVTLAGYSSLFTINTSTNTITIGSNATLQQLYDYCRYFLTLSANRGVTPFFSTSDGTHFTSTYNIVNNAVLSGTGYITTTGTVSGSGSTTVIYTTGSGTTGYITLTVPSGSSLAIYDQTPTLTQYIASTGTTVTQAVPAGVTGNYTYKVTMYGYTSVSGSIVVTGGGYFTNTISLPVDIGITQATAATVTAYTTLDNEDRLYDYAAYFETTSSGILYARPTTKVGTALSLGSQNLSINATAGSVYAWSGSGVTIKSSAFGDGSTMTSLTTTGTISYLNGAVFHTIITDSTGTTAIFTMTGLTNNLVYIADNTAAQQAYNASYTGSYVLYIPSSATGTWTWLAKAYGVLPVSGSFVVTGGGRFSASPVFATDPSITNTSSSSVAAYTTLATVDQMYDYAQYYITTAAGKALNQVVIKNGTSESLMSENLVVDATAASVFALASNTVTIKASTFGAGTTFVSFNTAGTVSTLHGAAITTYYTTGSSTYVMVYVTGLVAGSTVQLYDTTSSTELYNGVVAGTSYTLANWLYASGHVIRVRVRQPGYIPFETTTTASNIGMSVAVVQLVDSIYNSNAIVGSTVTEFSMTAGIIEVYIASTTNVTSAQRLYNWYQYEISLTTYIGNEPNDIVGQTPWSYVLADAILLKNTNSTPLFITGANLNNASNTGQIIDITGGTVIINGYFAFNSPTDIGNAVWSVAKGVGVVNTTNTIPATL